MKKKTLYAIAYCLSLISVLTAGGDKPVFYQLIYNADNVAGTVSINGFTIAELDGQSGSGSASLNVWLTGENEISADVKKSDGEQPCSFSVGLSKMSAGDIVDTMGKGNVFSIEKTDTDFKAGKTITVSKKFKSALDFSSSLAKTQAADEKEILAYAVKIHGLFSRKDADAIVKEFSIKLGDYDTAFSSSGSAGEFKSMLTDEILKGKVEKLDTVKLKLIKEGPSGCIWRVVQGTNELIRIVLPDGGIMEMPVYIGKINGEMKVVR
ncbi:MAG TPA: hypothetical protein PK573_13295 [Spirochaetota bacterium]|nr:hypothetical protein [Spirochaetota bacterium]